MRIAITLDSTCDLSEELLKKYDFRTVPFTVTLGERTFEDGKIDTREIFDYVEKGGDLPKTSAINEEAFLKFFADVKKDYDAIIHFDISAELSSAYQNAVTASKQFDNVYIIDSRSLSTGISLLAIYARNMTETCDDPKLIADTVQAMTDKVQASFVIERLDFLYKGGRCSSLAYYGANILGLRPELILQDGLIKSARKYRGKMASVVSKYCRDVLSDCPDPDKRICFITHTYARDDMVAAAYAAVRDAGFETVYETFAGCTVSSHCGRNTLGILFLNK